MGYQKLTYQVMSGLYPEINFLPGHAHFYLITPIFDRLLQLLTVGSQGVADEDIFYLHSFTVRLGYKLNLAELIASGTIDL